MTSTLLRPAAAAACALSLPLAGCGSETLDTGSGQSSTPAVSAARDGSLAAQVPARWAGRTITFGTDASYAPNEFLAPDGRTVQGMDIDLVRAAAEKLGLKVTFSNAGFSTILPGVASGKYDAGVSSFTITPERLKQVTMVSYFRAGTQWAVQTGNPRKVDPASPCGLTVSVQKGTTQADEIDALNRTTCASRKISTVVEDLQSKVTADLVSGKVDAMAADSPVTQYAVKQTAGKIQTVGQVTGAAPYGVVLPRAETQMGELLAKAFTALHADGTYARILERWGQTSGAVSTFAVNPTPEG